MTSSYRPYQNPFILIVSTSFTTSQNTYLTLCHGRGNDCIFFIASTFGQQFLYDLLAIKFSCNSDKSFFTFPVTFAFQSKPSRKTEIKIHASLYQFLFLIAKKLDIICVEYIHILFTLSAVEICRPNWFGDSLSTLA